MEKVMDFWWDLSWHKQISNVNFRIRYTTFPTKITFIYIALHCFKASNLTVLQKNPAFCIGQSWSSWWTNIVMLFSSKTGFPCWGLANQHHMLFPASKTYLMLSINAGYFRRECYLVSFTIRMIFILKDTSLSTVSDWPLCSCSQHICL